MSGSPWGTIQHSGSITRGVRAVSTASHGGLMVAPGWAEKYLSETARSYGEPYGSYLCYEEDCACCIVLYEIYSNQELRDVAEQDVKLFSDNRTVEEEREKLIESLSRYYPSYLEKRGI